MTIAVPALATIEDALTSLTNAVTNDIVDTEFLNKPHSNGPAISSPGRYRTPASVWKT